MVKQTIMRNALQGVEATRAAAAAAVGVADVLASTFGPRGLCVMLHSPTQLTVTRDGATVARSLSLRHPAALAMQQLASAQELAAGDGTTGVVLLASALLTHVSSLAEYGLAPGAAAEQVLAACRWLASEPLASMTEAPDEVRGAVARAVLSSEPQRDALTSLVLSVPPHALPRLHVLPVAGAHVSHSLLVRGVAFPRPFAYAGHAQLPRELQKPRVLLLTCELEHKHAKEYALISVSNPEEYGDFVAAEAAVFRAVLDAVCDAGATVVLSTASVGDWATQEFARRGVFAAGRVPSAVMRRAARVTNAVPQATLRGVSSAALGSAALFQQLDVAEDAPMLVLRSDTCCEHTLVLRGGAEHTLDELERSVDDAVTALARLDVGGGRVVPGGGATEAALACRLHDAKLSDVSPAVADAVSRALLHLPATLARNAELPVARSVARLRHALAAGVMWPGVNAAAVPACVVDDVRAIGLWDVADSKALALRNAAFVAASLLRVDLLLQHPPPNESEQQRAQRLSDERARSKRIQRKLARRPHLPGPVV